MGHHRWGVYTCVLFRSCPSTSCQSLESTPLVNRAWSHVTIRFYLLPCDDLTEAGIPLAYPSVEFWNTHWIGFESNPQLKKLHFKHVFQSVNFCVILLLSRICPRNKHSGICNLRPSNQWRYQQHIYYWCLSMQCLKSLIFIVNTGGVKLK